MAYINYTASPTQYVVSTTPSINTAWANFTINITNTANSLKGLATTMQLWGQSVSGVNWSSLKSRRCYSQVRCRDCARWAKIINDHGTRWDVECSRCPGLREGFIP